jgi:hypothetical protein
MQKNQVKIVENCFCIRDQYDQNQDYDIIQSNQEDMKKTIVRINLIRDHRQTVQYIE